MDYRKLKNVTTASELAKQLRQFISDGDMTDGDRLPSERKLADNIGLSRMTVRRAVEYLVDDGIVYRIAGSGTYVGYPDHDLSKTDNATLGLIVPTLANTFFGEVSDVIEQEARLKGYQLLVGRSEFDTRNEAQYLEDYALNPAVRGVLIVPSTDQTNQSAYKKLRSNKTPFVFVVRPDGVSAEDELNADAVMTNHRLGARRVVEHLIEQGHQQIAYIGAERPRKDNHKIGYLQALREADLEVDDRLIVSTADNAEEAGIIGTGILLERNVPFTAIFARIDTTALMVIRQLRSAGLQVPRDVAVAGFDNTQVAQYTSPPITSVDHSLSEIGRLAIWLLLDRLEEHYDGPARKVIISPRVVVRASTMSSSGVR